MEFRKVGDCMMTFCGGGMLVAAKGGLCWIEEPPKEMVIAYFGGIAETTAALDEIRRGYEGEARESKAREEADKPPRKPKADK